MSVTIKNAYAGQPGASATEAYDCPAGAEARVLKCTACNDTTTNVTFKVYKVPSGASVGDAYYIINDKTLISKDTYECPEVVGQVLDPGDKIYFHPSAADQVSFMLDVVEIT